MSGEVNIDRIIDAYDPLHDHLAILDFSASLEDVLEALAIKVIIVGKNVSSTNISLSKIQKKVDKVTMNVRSLKADI